MTDNIVSLNPDVARHYPKEGELAERIEDLIYEYAGEVGTAAAIGVLHIVADRILTSMKESLDQE